MRNRDGGTSHDKRIAAKEYDVDLAKILANVENRDDLIKQIEAEVGKEFVPRSEFNSKNNELKEVQKQLGELTTSFEDLSKEKANWDQTVADLNGKVAAHEKAALKAKVAREVGIPYELAGRLSGEDEKSLRADAESLFGLIKNNQKLPPLKSTEQPAGGKDAPYKALLENIKGE